jgi:hypothetical protein
MLADRRVLLLCRCRFARPAAYFFVGFVPVVVLSLTNVHADDEPRELPKDGAWSRYQLEDEENGKRVLSKTVTLSVVGTTIEDGETCRWLEIKSVVQEPPGIAGNYVSKILVPEKDLLGEKPFKNVRRAWTRRRDEPVKQQTKIDDWNQEPLLLWTPGMLKVAELAPNQSKDIEYQRGRLKDARAQTGVLTYDFSFDNKRRLKRVSKFTVWLHAEIPFAFAEARIIVEDFLDDKKFRKDMSVIYHIEDTGTDARSECPDNN